MKMYVGDWLTNASITGYVRIQESGGIKVKCTSDHVQITPEDLEGFTDRYFVFILEKYLSNAFTLNKEIRDKIKEKCSSTYDHNMFKKIQDDLEKITIPYEYNNFKKSSDVAQKSLEQFKKKSIIDVTKFLKNNSVKDQHVKSIIAKINKKLDKSISDVQSTITPKFLSNYLQRFYFNKHPIANPSSKDTFTKFKDICLQPAIETLSHGINEQNSVLCKFCKQNHVIITEFDDVNAVLTEGLFSPVLVSGKEFSNFFYNSQPDIFLCHVCKMLLLCTFAGFNDIPLVARDDTNNTDKMFVTLPDLKKTIEQNKEIEKEFKKNSSKFRNTAYQKILSNLFLKIKEKQAEWVIENILFIELKTVSRKDSAKPDFRYFSISRNIAEILNDDFCKKSFEYLNKSYELNKIKYNLIAQTMERILYHKTVYDLIHIIFHKELHTSLAFNLCMISAIRNVINNSVNIDNEVSRLESKTVYGTLKRLKDAGQSFSNIEYKKRKSLSFVLLESIRNNNYTQFYDIITKLYVEKERSIPDDIMLILNYQDPIGTKERAFAFLSGFVSQPQGDE